MSELRIRSEAAVDVWPESWLPRAAGTSAVGDVGPLVMAMAGALTGLFGVAVQALPASDDEAEALVDGGGVLLAAMLLAARLGGRMDVGVPGGRVRGAAWARFRAQVHDVAAAAGVWPAGLARIVLLVSVAGVEDLLEVLAPAGAVVPVVRGVDPGVAAQLAAVPMRLRVELAAETVSLARLVPLKLGQVLAIQPVPEMRLRMGDHAIGRVTVQAGPDGRQAATVVNLDIEQLGERT